jgi:Domain of unknown function (DUF6898)
MPLYCQIGPDNDFMARYQPAQSDEIIVEFTAMGNIMRVSAMDTESLTEVVVQGPINAQRSTLADLARQKLAFVMARKVNHSRR